MRIGHIRRSVWAALILLLVFSAALNVFVVLRDRVGDVYDALHLDRAGRLLACAVRGDAAAWTMFRAECLGSAYPPLLHYVALPVRLASGDAPGAGAVAVAIWSLLAVVAAFGIAHLLAGDRAGLLAAAFAAMTPGLYRFSRLEMVDAPLAAMTAAAIFFLLWSDGLAHRRRTLAFAATCSLGLLTKQSFPLYVGFPALYAIVDRLWNDDPEARTARLKNIGLAAGIILAVAAVAFGPSLNQWLSTRLAVRAAAVRMDKINLTDNLRLLLQDGLGPLLSALAALGMILVSKRDRGVRVLFAWFFPPLLLLHTIYGFKSTRYLLPLLPAADVFAALGLERLWSAGHGRRRTAQVAAFVLLLAAITARDHLRADWTAFTFDSFEDRVQFVGVPRPQRLGWSVAPVVDKLAAGGANRHIVMLLDSPYSSLVQGGLWRRDPQADVANFFERFVFGRLPPEFETVEGLAKYLAAADVILVKTGYNRDPRSYSYLQNVDPLLAQRVFAAFFAVKDRFELVGHFPYPEDPGPVLIYQKRLGD
jgi:hypothetical protein